MGILDRFSLKGRNALVTGGARGIGRSLAEALAEAGANVAIVDVNLALAESTAQDIQKLGVEVLAVGLDVIDAAQVSSVVERIHAQWGRLDIAVNSAGIARRSPSEQIEEAEWDAILKVNLKGVFLCSQAEGRVMLAQGSGSIINVASMSGQIVNRPQQHAHYNASKAGVVQVTRTLAAEWASRGVRVNSISPGHTNTPMTAHASAVDRETWVSNTPMARLGEPSDLQGAVIYLASDASSYVTGHDLIVDGGYTLG
jgi:NAD(P)-dependent dehydrogenase (short-subunit alcohol dehydrogenase family)